MTSFKSSSISLYNYGDVNVGKLYIFLFLRLYPVSHRAMNSFSFTNRSKANSMESFTRLEVRRFFFICEIYFYATNVNPVAIFLKTKQLKRFDTLYPLHQTNNLSHMLGLQKYVASGELFRLNPLKMKSDKICLMRQFYKCVLSRATTCQNEIIFFAH